MNYRFPARFACGRPGLLRFARNDGAHSLCALPLYLSLRGAERRGSPGGFGKGLVLFSGLPRFARNDGSHSPCALPLYSSLRGAERRGSPGGFGKGLVLFSGWFLDCRALLAMTAPLPFVPCLFIRHCEERSDAAVQEGLAQWGLPLASGLMRFARNDGISFFVAFWIAVLCSQ